jgi:hypothetical protein
MLANQIFAQRPADGKGEIAEIERKMKRQRYPAAILSSRGGRGTKICHTLRACAQRIKSPLRRLN